MDQVKITKCPTVVSLKTVQTPDIKLTKEERSKVAKSRIKVKPKPPLGKSFF